MKLMVSRKLIGTAVLALLVLTMSTEVFGQGRNRRYYGGNSKKCAKFVNCHDARDGRWDGRGPRRNTLLTSRIFRRTRRDRDDYWNGRRGRRDRDFDRDRNWRRRR